MSDAQFPTKQMLDNTEFRLRDCFCWDVNSGWGHDKGCAGPKRSYVTRADVEVLLATAERYRTALEVLSYEGPAAVAAYNSPGGIPIPSKAVKELAKKALRG